VDLFTERGFVIADGKRMAVGFPQRRFDSPKSLYLLSDYHPTTISCWFPSVEVETYGNGPFRVAGQAEVTLEIKAYGVQSVPFEEGIKLFRNADSLSVNELLAIAYQKMDSRQS
jgi:hypothetical protein